jgi:hypothetical protein
MHTTKSAALSALGRHATWLRKVTWEQGQRESSQHRAVDLSVGCFRICIGCGLQVREWLNRKPGRKAILKPMAAIKSESGRRALVDLVALSQAALEARSWETNAVEIGPLSVGEPRSVSDAHRQASGDRLRKLHQDRKQAEEETRQKRAEFVARTVQVDPEHHPSTESQKTIEKHREIDGVLMSHVASDQSL